MIKFSKNLFFSMLIFLVLGACSGGQIETPVVPTSTNTPIPPTSTVTHTPEPTPTATPAVYSFDDLIMPHSIENQEACDMCHEIDKVEPFPENHNGRSIESCLYCHLDGEEIETPPDVNQFTKTDCLTCHGTFEQIILEEHSAVAEDGNTVNPHAYIPHDSSESESIPECSECHQPHKLPSISIAESAEFSKAPIETCYDCHHVRNFTDCSQCHVIIPQKE